jgi:hypothetical protein
VTSEIQSPRHPINPSRDLSAQEGTEDGLAQRLGNGKGSGTEFLGDSVPDPFAFLSGRRFALYFFEVNSGSQTLGFVPTAYVDITTTRPKKKAALLAHRSQDGAPIYRNHHEVMENFRGRELIIRKERGRSSFHRVEPSLLTATFLGRPRGRSV